VEVQRYQEHSGKNAKEKFNSLNEDGVVGKVGGKNGQGGNDIDERLKQFRHYGLVDQDFVVGLAADGDRAMGGPTSLTSTDMNGVLMLAVQALGQENDAFKVENAELKARIEALEGLVKGMSPKVEQ